MVLTLLIIVMVTALVFEYINGFHDSANAIATVVSTKVLTARAAIIYAGVLNMVGAFMGTHVASTIGKGIVSTEMRYPGCYSLRPAVGHHLEFDHLVLRHPFQFLPCSDRRPDGSGDFQGRLPCRFV
jgi:hypothetical protein